MGWVVSARVSAVSDFHISLIYPYGVSVLLLSLPDSQTKIRLDFGLHQRKLAEREYHQGLVEPRAAMFSSALKSFTSNISSNYTISPSPSSISGAWKVYDGKKKSTGKVVSIFVFEKKSLEPQSGGLGGRSSGALLKKLHDEVISRVKKECNLLARLRHPSILELAEPIEDTRSGGLMFATEPVTASLAGLLQEKDEQEKTGGVQGRASRYVLDESGGQKTRRELEIDELEIQKGLLQIAQGLEFLHESASLVHGNLTPDAIYINIKVS